MRRLVAALAMLVSAASAGGAADFYQGKTIRMLVGSAPGGGYDSYARTFVQHLRRHIPGDPTIVVQNMPGAGGMVVTNWLYNVAPKDGTAFGLLQRGIPFHPFFGEKNAKFTPTEFNWIGSFNSETSVVSIMSTSKVKTLKDALTMTAVLGGSGPNDSETHPSLMNNTIGTKFRIAGGYKSNTEVLLAMERGEVEGLGGSWGSLKALRPHWLRDRQVNVIVQTGRAKHPDLPDVPMIEEFVTQPEHQQMWRVMVALGTLGRPLTAPPGVPAEAVKILRAGFEATMKDPDYRAEMEKSNRELDPVGAAEVQEALAEVAQVPHLTLLKLNDWIKRQ